jgi:hypothetical protein
MNNYRTAFALFAAAVIIAIKRTIDFVLLSAR